MPSITLLYHYFHPDDVVSARHFTGLAKGLKERGWEVEVIACNRGCREEGRTFPLRETYQGIHVRRVWRPGLKQSSGVGRIVNALWMLAAWSSIAMRPSSLARDVLLVGTDPVLSVLVAGLVKRMRPKIKVAHLVYDLYPEVGIADGLLREQGLPVRVLRTLVGWAYARCDLIVDIGPCMRRRLAEYSPPHRKATLVPWALVEPTGIPPPHPSTRERLFGAAPLALLYSGSLGRAHEYDPFLALARRLRGEAAFCFAVRGSSTDRLRNSVGAADSNVRVGAFVPESEVETHLSAADVHLASLRPGWTGLVVPSKFFGSLAVGRPVLFAGDPESSIGRWIRELGVGWVLQPANIEQIAAEMRELAAHPATLAALQRRCFEVYRTHFAYQCVLDSWDRELRAVLADPAHVGDEATPSCL
jgi:glycosyltransferase involved in cell wall biosynthesis